MTTTHNTPDPPAPTTIESSLQNNQMQYNEFADKMICAVHGKSRYGGKVTKTM